MAANHEIIVIGLGGMGSAALLELARRGVSALGIEQFDIGHDRGSTHGETRLIRRAYYEHPDYVPLVDESFRKWAQLEAECGQRLFFKSGLFLAGPPEGELISGTRLAARLHRLDIESVRSDQCGERFPLFVPAENMEVMFEPDAGFLLVEQCVRTSIQLAEAHGAAVAPGTVVRRWRQDGGSYEVETSGETYRCERLIVCGGPWTDRMLADLALPLEVRRKVVLWYAVHDDRYSFDNGFPVFGFDVDGGFFYGFPCIDGRTLKVCEHTGGETADPDHLDRSLHQPDAARVRAFADRHLVGLDQTLVKHSVCMYTMSPDQHFIIDRHPLDPHVSFVAGLSGHGFKFAPVIGSALADLALGEAPPPNFAFFSLSRPGLSPRLPSPREQ